jgi:hypothetical protein
VPELLSLGSKMTRKRKIFFAIVAAVLLLDVTVHFLDQWRAVTSADTPPSGAYLVLFLAWNTFAGSIEIFTSPLGILVIAGFIWGFMFTRPIGTKAPDSK